VVASAVAAIISPMRPSETNCTPRSPENAQEEAAPLLRYADRKILWYAR